MKYTIWRYTEAGFGHGWNSEQADTIPEGAVSVSVFEGPHADKSSVYAVENAPAPAEKEQV